MTQPTHFNPIKSEINMGFHQRDWWLSHCLVMPIQGPSFPAQRIEPGMHLWGNNSSGNPHSKMWFTELVVCMTIKRSLRMVCANYGEQPILFNPVKSEIFAWFHQKHTCVNQSFCQSGLYVPETVKTRMLLFRWIIFLCCVIVVLRFCVFRSFRIFIFLND